MYTCNKEGGREGGREEERKEGRKEGWMDEWMDGWKDGREGGRGREGGTTKTHNLMKQCHKPLVLCSFILPLDSGFFPHI